MPCIGNAKETCGGSNGLSLYELTSAYNFSLTATTSSQTASSTISSSTTTSATPTASGISGYSYVACWTDNPSDRTLSALSEVNYALTLEMCASFCSGYTYFGVEYWRECKSNALYSLLQDLTNTPEGYCGNSLLAGTVAATDGRCYYGKSQNFQNIVSHSTGLGSGLLPASIGSRLLERHCLNSLLPPSKAILIRNSSLRWQCYRDLRWIKRPFVVQAESSNPFCDQFYYQLHL
jgi:hypothetical protein